MKSIESFNQFNFDSSIINKLSSIIKNLNLQQASLYYQHLIKLIYSSNSSSNNLSNIILDLVNQYPNELIQFQEFLINLVPSQDSDTINLLKAFLLNSKLYDYFIKTNNFSLFTTYFFQLLFYNLEPIDNSFFTSKFSTFLHSSSVISPFLQECINQIEFIHFIFRKSK
jgi:hypothetical protein